MQEYLSTIINNYENLTSVTGRSLYYPISMGMPWNNENPIVRERYDHEMLTNIFEKLKCKEIFNFFVNPYDIQGTRGFSIMYRNIVGNKMQTNNISLEPESRGLNPLLPLLPQSIDWKNSAIDYIGIYVDKFVEAIDNFFISDLIRSLGNDVTTELGYIKDSNQLHNAIYRIIEHNVEHSYNGIKYIFIHPDTYRELKTLLMIPTLEFQGLNDLILSFEIIESSAVPEEYMYTMPPNTEGRLTYIIGLINLLGVDRLGGYYINCDNGLVDSNAFGRIRLKSTRR